MTSHVDILSPDQVYDAYELTNTLVDNLDSRSVRELWEGSGRDIDKLLSCCVDEFVSTLNCRNINFTAYSHGYLDSFARSAQETFRKISLAYFIIDCLPEFTFNWHHYEWSLIPQLYKKFSILACRDGGKSYMYSYAYPLWKLYRYSLSGEDGYRTEYMFSREGMIVTSERSLAEHFMTQVKSEIEDNELLRHKLYPDGGKKSNRWGSGTITCKNGASLFVKSYGSKMRGRHPSWIIADDFLTDQALYSKTQRDKYINFFTSVIENMIIPGGSVGIVGTPFHSADLYGHLKKGKVYKVFEYPAIFPDGRLLWAGRHSFNGLMEKKDSQGTVVFSREVLVRPVSSESSVFPHDILVKSTRGMEFYKLVDNIHSHPLKGEFKRVVTGCDFAISSSASADYSAFGTIGITSVDNIDHYWLLNVYHEKGKTYNEQKRKIKQLHGDFNFDIAVLESVQMQQIFVQGAEEMGLPVQGHHTSAKSKYDLKEGIPSLAILFEQGRIHFPQGDDKSRNIVDMMFDQLQGMSWSDNGIESTTEHDDLVMMLLMCIIAARKGSGFSFGFI